jgi:hypothetical protein
MDDVDLTDAQLDRLESLRATLGANTDPYATVTPRDTIEYLLDMADEIDEPTPASASLAAQLTEASSSQPFPRAALREQLECRRLSHSDPEAADEMDLYTIAVEFDIEGRSSMQKAELIDAILDAAEQQYTNPFGSVDIDFPGPTAGDTEDTEKATETAPETDSNADAAGTAGDATDATAEERVADETSEDGVADEGTEADDADEGDTSDGGSGQLDAMLSLLETHDEKWWSTDGDARYKVELPDGNVETARTKDDVRAMLFKNY